MPKEYQYKTVLDAINKGSYIHSESDVERLNKQKIINEMEKIYLKNAKPSNIQAPFGSSDFMPKEYTNRPSY